VFCHHACRSLSFERHHYNASHGINGGAAGRKGKQGKDLYLRVPLGTVITEVVPEVSCRKLLD
jgi:GTPase involved in cell partitioning and DNA repair